MWIHCFWKLERDGWRKWKYVDRKGEDLAGLGHTLALSTRRLLLPRAELEGEGGGPSSSLWGQGRTLLAIRAAVEAWVHQHKKKLRTTHNRVPHRREVILADTNFLPTLRFYDSRVYLTVPKCKWIYIHIRIRICVVKQLVTSQDWICFILFFKKN